MVGILIGRLQTVWANKCRACLFTVYCLPDLSSPPATKVELLRGHNSNCANECMPAANVRVINKHAPWLINSDLVQNNSKPKPLHLVIWTCECFLLCRCSFAREAWATAGTVQLYKQMPIYAIVTEKKKFWGNTSAPFYLSPPHSVPHEPGQPSYYTSISEARGPHGPRKSITPKRRQIPTCRWLTGCSFLKEPGDLKKNWWFDCTLRPKTGTFTTLSKITAVSERYLFLPNFSHFSFAPVLTKPSFSYTKMTEVISHAQLLVCLHGPAAMKVSGL